MNNTFHVFAYDQFVDEAVIEEHIFSTDTKQKAIDFIGKQKTQHLSYKIHEGEMIVDDEGGYCIQ